MKTNHAPIEPLELRIAPATIIVTTLKDISSPAFDSGSLRDAIEQANASVGVADEIVFQTPAGKPLKGTIKLLSGLPEITDPLTITGPVAGKASGLTINGNKNSILSVNGADFAMEDITLKNGFSSDGGGLYLNAPGETIELTNLVVMGNRAHNSGGDAFGGGISIQGGTEVILKDSIVTGNAATGVSQSRGGVEGVSSFGGGIYIDGTLRIENSLISKNTAQAGPLSGGQGSGGGIFVDGATTKLTVIGSTISGNKAIGGAGLSGAPKTSVDGMAGGSGNGGGISGTATTILEITDTLISSNSAKGGNGGKGGSAQPGDSGGDGGNAGGGFGGGIKSLGELTLKDSVLTKNSAIGAKGGAGGAGGGGFIPGTPGFFGIGEGGGLHATNKLTVETTTVSKNSAADLGGGAALIGGSAAVALDATIDSSTFSGNKGTGIYMYDTVKVLIKNTTVASNTAAFSGGGIVVEDFDGGSDVKIHNSTIAKNSARFTGGGFSFNTSDTVEIVSSIIAGNKAKVDADLEYDDSLGGAGVVLTSSLIQKVTAATILEAASANNLENMDPKLGVLRSNGGATFTMLPTALSPVIDKGSNPDALTSDQRGAGFDRTKGVATDIGAVEVA